MRPGQLGRWVSAAWVLAAATVATAGAVEGSPPWGRASAGPGLASGLFQPSDAGTFSDSGGIPRDRLIEMVQRRFNARVVRVNPMESGGRLVYEMRLMSEQRVWNVRVDAATGQVLDGG